MNESVPAQREALDRLFALAADRLLLFIRLEPEEREALLLRYFQNLSQEEIAQRIGRSPTATRRLLARALLRVGTEFGHV